MIGEETWKNATGSLLEVVEDLASPEIARSLAEGPINGFIDSSEYYLMFDDFRSIIEAGINQGSYDERLAHIREALCSFDKTLERVTDPGEMGPERISDRERTSSDDWARMQAQARHLVPFLKGLVGTALPSRSEV